MARGRRDLDPIQKAALDDVRKRNEEYQLARRYAHEEARRQADEKIRHYAEAVDVAVHYAVVTLGIPKNQVGLSGLGVKNPYAVYNALQRAEALVVPEAEAAHTSPQTGRERFRWGEILSGTDAAIYGFVLDANMPHISTITPLDSIEHDGIYVNVDRLNGTTILKVGDGDFLTEQDGGYSELRRWALEHAAEAE